MAFVDITDLVVEGKEVEEGVWEFVFKDGTRRRLRVKHIEGPEFKGVDEKTGEEFLFNVELGQMWKILGDTIVIVYG